MAAAQQSFAYFLFPLIVVFYLSIFNARHHHLILIWCCINEGPEYILASAQQSWVAKSSNAEVNNSGPSLGEGHAIMNSFATELIQLNNSGPSPGEGHADKNTFPTLVQALEKVIGAECMHA